MAFISNINLSVSVNSLTDAPQSAQLDTSKDLPVEKKVLKRAVLVLGPVSEPADEGKNKPAESKSWGKISTPIVKQVQFPRPFNEIPRILYAPRVERWLSCDPSQPLDAAVFSDYSGLPKRLQPHIIMGHAFSREVDRYINCGFKTLFTNNRTGNQDSRYMIIGTMTFNNKTEKGFFVYTFGEDKVCYHRFFNVKECLSSQAKAKLKKTVLEAEFPTLNNATKVPDNLSVEKRGSITITTNPVIGNVLIEDAQTQCDIELNLTPR